MKIEAKVSSHWCNLHENNHSTSKVYNLHDFINSEFCIMRILHEGPVWADILVAMILDYVTPPAPSGCSITIFYMGLALGSMLWGAQSPKANIKNI